MEAGLDDSGVEPIARIAAKVGAEARNAGARRVDDIGVLDFQTLDDSAMMTWLQVLEIWPKDMALSLDLQKLGLSEEDLTAENIKAREESETRKREERAVSFNGRFLDPKEVDLVELSEELYEALSQKVLGKALASTPDLADVGRNADLLQEPAATAPDRVEVRACRRKRPSSSDDSVSWRCITGYGKFSPPRILMRHGGPRTEL